VEIGSEWTWKRRERASEVAEEVHQH